MEPVKNAMIKRDLTVVGSVKFSNNVSDADKFGNNTISIVLEKGDKELDTLLSLFNEAVAAEKGKVAAALAEDIVPGKSPITTDVNKDKQPTGLKMVTFKKTDGPPPITNAEGTLLTRKFIKAGSKVRIKFDAASYTKNGASMTLRMKEIVILEEVVRAPEKVDPVVAAEDSVL